jgi:hypothetical protein
MIMDGRRLIDETTLLVYRTQGKFVLDEDDENTNLLHGI